MSALSILHNISSNMHISYVGAIQTISIIFSLVSVGLWWRSASVKFQFGFDMDAALNESMKKAAKLNAWAATFSGLAILFQALSGIS